MISEYRVQTRRRTLLYDCAKVLVSSRHMKREYERQGIAPDRVVLVPLPTRSSSELLPPVPKARTDRVLFVGRLTTLKGGRALVEAIAIARRVLGIPLRLVVAGEGEERRQVQQLATRLEVEIEFAGWVDAAQREVLMKNADVLAVPSLWPEPFGMVGIEAGALGLPSVAYATGGIPDWLEPGISGELAPGDRPTVAGLADALIRALRDPKHLGRLSVGAWKSARQYTMEAHLAALEPLLTNAAAGRGTRQAAERARASS
jgi:glycosyltransferase involved in cell wall biosynthesis